MELRPVSIKNHKAVIARRPEFSRDNEAISIHSFQASHMNPR